MTDPIVEALRSLTKAVERGTMNDRLAFWLSGHFSNLEFWANRMTYRLETKPLLKREGHHLHWNYDWQVSHSQPYNHRNQ